MRFAVGADPLSLETLSLEVKAEAQAHGEGCGALCSFVGVVRATHRGRRVRYLEYEAFDTLALNVFRQIERETARHMVAVHKIVFPEDEVLTAEVAAR